MCGAQRSKKNHAQGGTACRALAAWHEAARQPGGAGVAAAALTRRRLPRCLRPATDPRQRASGPTQPRQGPRRLSKAEARWLSADLACAQEGEHRWTHLKTV